MEKIENFGKIEKQACEIQIIPLSDDKTFEMYIEPKSQKIKECFVRNKNGEIIKFTDFDFNKNFFEEAKRSCSEKGIVIKDDEIEKIAEKRAADMLNNIDENESIEN